MQYEKPSSVFVNEAFLPVFVTTTVANCVNATTISVDPNNQIYDSRDNCNAIIETATNTLLYGFATTVIPNTIVKIGDYAFNKYNIESINVPEGEKTFGQRVFENCNQLTTVTLPNSLTNIGTYTFYQCSSLVNINIPEGSLNLIGAYCFEYCTSLETIYIPNNIRTIDTDAFRSCSKLTNVNIENNNVTRINATAFAYCTNLDFENLSNTVTNLGRSVFNSTAWYNRQPDGEIYTGKVFYKYKGNMPKNTEITLNEGIVDIAGEAFDSKNGLISIYIPNSVKIIGPYAFYNCKNLSNINIPNNLNIIYDYAFNNCESITDIILPNTVSSLGTYIFENCTNLKNIILSTALTSIPAGTFSSCTKLESIILPNNIKTIGTGAFSNCTILNNINLHNNITTIGYNALLDTSWYNNLDDGLIYANDKVLYDYKGIMPENTHIIIDHEIVSITGYAFSHEDNLISISLPNTLENIGTYTFNMCQNLIQIISYAINPPTLSNRSIYGISEEIKIYVPDESLELYRNASFWSNYSSNIYPISDLNI